MVREVEEKRRREWDGDGGERAGVESVVYVLTVNEREDIKISPQLESYSLHYVGNKCTAL